MATKRMLIMKLSSLSRTAKEIYGTVGKIVTGVMEVPEMLLST